MSKTIVGIFDDYGQAENAAQQVKDNNLRTDEISIISKGDDQEGSFGGQNDMVNDNVSDGTVTGGVFGGVAGLLLGMGTLAIPGLGVIAAAGPIAGLLTGALTGGIVGGMVDLGIPEDAGQVYEQDVIQGKIFWSMDTEEENVDDVAYILKSCGATSVDYY